MPTVTIDYKDYYTRQEAKLLRSTRNLLQVEGKFWGKGKGTKQQNEVHPCFLRDLVLH